MMFRLTIFIALAAVLVQSYVPISYEEKLLLDDSAVEDVLDDLNKVVAKAIVSAKAKLATVVDTLTAKENSIVVQAKQALNSEFVDLLEEVKDIKDEATELGLDIADCLKDREDYLKGLPAKYGKKIQECGADKINLGKLVVETATASVEGCTKEVKKLAKEMSDCGDTWKAVWCKAQVAASSSIASIDIPVKLLDIATDTLTLVQTLPFDLKQCGVSVSREFVKDGRKVVSSIQTCAINKLTGTDSKP